MYGIDVLAEVGDPFLRVKLQDMKVNEAQIIVEWDTFPKWREISTIRVEAYKRGDH